MKLTSRTLRLFGLLALLALVMTPGAGTAQSNSRTFPETGKTVSGIFLQYWDTHGALPQQGFPKSDEMQEKSDLNGQTYTVQYFERAVFEKHPENAGTPFEVLLSQLGTFRYRAKYPNGAPGQQANSSNPRTFPETGKTIGGKFRTYWEAHGGLPQQGFPISDEFTEVSDLNGQPYKVQYFERAVFEMHPENQPPFDVLLSQLGTFQYRCKYQGGPCVGQGTQPTQPPQPPPATAVPTQQADPCADVPASRDMTVSPKCGPGGTTFSIAGTGFTPGEQVGRYYTTPSGEVFEGSSQSTADSSGRVTGISLHTTADSELGVWAGTFEGVQSHHVAIAYFKVTGAGPVATQPPGGSCDASGSQNGAATPSSARVGQQINFRATGFRVGESVSYWFTTPSGLVVGTAAPRTGLVNGDGSIGPLPLTLDPALINATGRWGLTFQGAASGNVAVIYFCVLP